MPVAYEWKLEQTQTLDTEQFEAGEIRDSTLYDEVHHAHRSMILDDPIEGCHYELCLVRSEYNPEEGVTDQQWAYMDKIKLTLPKHFVDGCDRVGVEVPARYKQELRKAMGG